MSVSPAQDEAMEDWERLNCGRQLVHTLLADPGLGGRWRRTPTGKMAETAEGFVSYPTVYAGQPHQLTFTPFDWRREVMTWTSSELPQIEELGRRLRRVLPEMGRDDSPDIYAA